jgi:hypothetical protein
LVVSFPNIPNLLNLESDIEEVSNLIFNVGYLQSSI